MQPYFSNELKLPVLRNKLVFLFGAGISIPAGLPSGDDLTKKIITTTEFYRDTSGHYSWEEQRLATDRTISEPIFKGILLIYSYLIETGKQNPSYEDIYYLSSILSVVKPKPQYVPFMKEMELRFSLILKDENGSLFRNVSELCISICDYIQQFIWHQLSIEPENTDYLQVIADAHNDNKIDEIQIFTLNHDLVLEKFFDSKNIGYIDGFDNSSNDVMYWDEKVYNRSEKVKIYKLHGSINWFVFQNDFDFSKPERLGKIIDNDIFYKKNADNQLLWPKDGIPLFLTGTDNKVLEYSKSYFYELNHYFREALFSTKDIIVSGYSFRDIGINQILKMWLTLESNRIINISEVETDFHIKVTGIKKWIESVKYPDIKENLRCPTI